MTSDTIASNPTTRRALLRGCYSRRAGQAVLERVLGDAATPYAGQAGW